MKFPIHISRQLASNSRESNFTVMRMDESTLSAVNQRINSGTNLAGQSNPDTIAAPKVTDMFIVGDLDSPAYHCVFLHRLDPSTQLTTTADKVVVFSKPEFALGCTSALQLATPRYFRNQEDLEDGIRDPYEGTRTKDASGWASSITGGKVSSQMTFTSLGEPWVYCASYCRSTSELDRLFREFDDRYGYSAATRILNPDAFATWLGIDFVLGLDVSKDISHGPWDLIADARRRIARLREDCITIDKYVHVYYGRITYEDVSGYVNKQEHFCDFNSDPKAWFTKKSAFADQNEYRFAVSTRGVPVNSKYYISVSPELRACTCAA